jgi:hypothetical protein
MSGPLVFTKTCKNNKNSTAMKQNVAMDAPLAQEKLRLMQGSSNTHTFG